VLKSISALKYLIWCKSITTSLQKVINKRLEDNNEK